MFGNLYAVENVYVDALGHFVDSVVVAKFRTIKKGETLCFKKVLGITEAFPDSVKGYKILIVDDDNLQVIPDMEVEKGMKRIYYMFPMEYDSKNDCFYIFILDAILLKNNKMIYRGYEIHRFTYRYNRRKRMLEYVEKGWDTGTYSFRREIPWRSK